MSWASDFSNYTGREREWEWEWEWVDVSAAGKQPMNSGSGGSFRIAIASAARRGMAWCGSGVEWETQRRRGLARLGLSMQHGDAGAADGAGAEKRRFGRAENLKQFVKRLWIASGNVQEA